MLIYLDLDCFFVQAECYRRPELRGKPLVIQQVQHGGFIAVSYEAREQGIKRGDGTGIGLRSVAEARRKCPNLVIVPVDMPHNRFVSQEVEQFLKNIFKQVVVQRNSIDDFCLDCSVEIESRVQRKEYEEILFGNFCSLRDKQGVLSSEILESVSHGELALTTFVTLSLAREIQESLEKTLKGTTGSLSVARSKVLARLIVPYRKPKGITFFQDQQAEAIFLHQTSVTKVHGLRGLGGEAVMRRLSLLTGKSYEELVMADLALFDRSQLALLFGDKMGEILDGIGRGNDWETIKDRGEPKSILVELSGDEIYSTIDIYKAFAPLIEDLLHRIVDDSRRFKARQPTKLSIRWRRTEKMFTGSSSFKFPSVLSMFLRNANSANETPPSQVMGYKKVLEAVLERCVTQLTSNLASLKIREDERQINRLGVVASAFVSGSSSTLISFVENSVQLSRDSTPNFDDCLKVVEVAPVKAITHSPDSSQVACLSLTMGEKAKTIICSEELREETKHIHQCTPVIDIGSDSEKDCSLEPIMTPRVSGCKRRRTLYQTSTRRQACIKDYFHETK